MTKYVCDRCGNSVSQRQDLFYVYSDNVTLEVGVDHNYKPELCSACLRDVENVIGEKIERKN